MVSSVHLPVTRISKKFVNRFYEIFWRGVAWLSEESVRF